MDHPMHSKMYMLDSDPGYLQNAPIGKITPDFQSTSWDHAAWIINLDRASGVWRLAQFGHRKQIKLVIGAISFPT
jgi:hypothetical protein